MNGIFEIFRDAFLGDDNNLTLLADTGVKLYGDEGSLMIFWSFCSFLTFSDTGSPPHPKRQASIHEFVICFNFLKKGNYERSMQTIEMLSCKTLTFDSFLLHHLIGK